MISKFRVEWLVYRLDDPVSTSLPDIGSSSDRWIIADESSIQRFFASKHLLRRRFQHFLRSGCLGLFLIRDDRWVAYAWSMQPGSRGHPPHLLRRTLPADAYWIFYCHTHADFRGQGIFKRVLVQLISIIQARSADAPIYVDVLPGNVPSNRAVTRTGFIPSGVIIVYKLWLPLGGGLVFSGKWMRDRPHFPQHSMPGPAIRP